MATVVKRRSVHRNNVQRQRVQIFCVADRRDPIHDRRDLKIKKIRLFAFHLIKRSYIGIKIYIGYTGDAFSVRSNDNVIIIHHCHIIFCEGTEKDNRGV